MGTSFLLSAIVATGSNVLLCVTPNVRATQLTKFHGIYPQDDRDIREEREAQGVGCLFIPDLCAAPWWCMYPRTVARDGPDCR